MEQLNRTFFVIDSNADFLRLYSSVFRLHGCDCITARSGYEANQILRKNPRIDMLLVDAYLDDMTGVEFLSLLHFLNSWVIEQRIPVLYLTDEKHIPTEIAATGVVSKTFDLDSFVTHVTHYLDHKVRE